MSLPRKIETFANLATIAVAILLSVVLVKIYLLPASPATLAAKVPPQGAPTAAVGLDLNGRLQGVDWKKNGRTLVLAISTSCHFCTDSQPFYRKLQQEAGKGIKFVAVLPQSVGEAQRYLNGADLNLDGIRQVSFPDLGVKATPTILLVNRSGVITNVWIGKIPPEQENEVLSVLKKG
jgi:hypothetical protein